MMQFYIATLIPENQKKITTRQTTIMMMRNLKIMKMILKKMRVRKMLRGIQRWMPSSKAINRENERVNSARTTSADSQRYAIPILFP
uniref:Uncharacterized protein n=1 Tax=Ciona savignyi TaxID=51511 RepID=H2Y919_CIOSA